MSPSPTPSPGPRRRMPTPFSEMGVLRTGYNTPLHITPRPQPSLPPLHYSPEPVLTHKADPSPVTFVESQDQAEEPRYILQLVPNPKYKSSTTTVTTTRRPQRDLGLQQQSVHTGLRRKDPSLYPYLYVLSSYLPQTQHSLVVAKKS